MFFQQELWLIIVGLLVARIVKKANNSHVAFKTIALWSCAMSLLVGELGMVTQLFFPSDVTGFLLTGLAALIGANLSISEKAVVARTRKASTRQTAPKSTNTRKRKN